jgi:hypothetical protein
MKNYFKSFMGLAVAVLMSMVAVSCEKDSSGKKGVINRDNIVGEWQLESIQCLYYKNGKFEYSETDNCDDWYLIYDFQKGGVGTRTDYSYGEINRESIEWELVANKLTLIYVEYDEAESLTVESLTGNKLVLSWADVWEKDGIECKEVGKYTFRR